MAMAISSASPVASAFVTPRYQRLPRARRIILGKWRVSSVRDAGVTTPLVGLELVLEITSTTIRRVQSGVGDPTPATYEVTDQDDTSVDLLVKFPDNDAYQIDVLVDGQDALTLYVRDAHDPEDHERVVRVERLDK